MRTPTRNKSDSTNRKVGLLRSSNEFFVHLRKPVEPAPRQTADAYRQFRHALLTSINGQLGSAAYNEENEAEGPEPRRRPFDEAAEKVLGQAAVSAVRDWNARRLARRRGSKDRH